MSDQLGFFEMKGVTKQFGGVVAVDDFCIEVSREEVFGLIGPNGAGKTTVFNLITGIYKPTVGKIFLSTHNPWDRRR